MSGLVGSITRISKEFNDIGTNSTVEGIKMANFIEGKIRNAEIARDDIINEQEQEQELNFDTANLVADIEKDMEDDRER